MDNIHFQIDNNFVLHERISRRKCLSTLTCIVALGSFSKYVFSYKLIIFILLPGNICGHLCIIVKPEDFVLLEGLEIKYKYVMLFDVQ